MKIFLDCGSNIGQGFEEFRSKFGIDDIMYWLFEPDVKCYTQLIEKYGNLNYVKIHNCAVSTRAEELTFYTTRDYDLGGTVIYEHNNFYYDNQNVNSYQVHAIDLIELAQGLINQNYKIYLKLDVESSEYDILEKMITTGVIKNIEEIYCEFHSQYMKEPEKTTYWLREKNILNYVKEKNINFKLWK